MTLKTPFYDQHVAAGAKMVPFGGWEMPLHYGSQIEEHHAVRTDCGLFDVSHMTVVDIEGPGATGYLRRLLANDVARLTEPGKALYGAMLNERGGVIDDLIVYRRANDYRCVVNAATREKDLAWMQSQLPEEVKLKERDLAMLAIQGPQALRKLSAVTALAGLHELKAFALLESDNAFIGRTGYTGEDGFEVILPADEGITLWRALVEAGVPPIGLGARDTLRLEAGLNLYGQDLDEDTSPLASNLGWTVAWEPEDRAFIGRAAIASQRGRCPMKLVGLVLRARAVLRHGQRVVTAAGEGVITSGTFSPTLQCSIALARVPAGAADHCKVEIRGKQMNAEIVRPPFVRKGKVLV